MAKSATEADRQNGENQGVLLKTWADSYAEVSRVWEDSFLRLQKPVIETTGALAEKAGEISKEPTPEHYEEFWDEWSKASRENLGGFVPTAPDEFDEDTLVAFIATAESSQKLYKSWVSDLDENIKATKEALKGKQDPDQFRERYESWMNTYEKIFNQTLELSSMESTKEIVENYTGVPDVYLESFFQISRLWRDSYSKLYEPWVDAASKLSRKEAELNEGNVRPEAYEEFFHLWNETYQETYGKYVESVQPTKEVFDTFVQSTDVYLNMYKSWIAALENMAKKTSAMSAETPGGEMDTEFYGLWMKIYEKAFGNFFEDMPMQRPMKDTMEPIKAMAKINTDNFARMSRVWGKNFGAGSEG